MSAGEQLKAKYDFQATDKAMLSFKATDQFSLVRKTSLDWWTVRSTSGEEGLAPVNYLEVYQARGGGPAKSAAYTALYVYTAQDATQLSFGQGETLILIDKTDVSWWRMKNSSGGQGLVPVNYIDKLDTEQEKQVNKTDRPSEIPRSNGNTESPEYRQVLQSIDSQIQRIHDRATAEEGKYSGEQKAALNRLVIYRKEYVESHGWPTTNYPFSSEKITQPVKSPNSSPKSETHSKTLAPQPGPMARSAKHAPPPPSEADKTFQNRNQSETSQVVRREKSTEINSLRDNRYSLQVSSNSGDLSDPYRPRFGSLPRRSAPVPPNRRGSIPKANILYTPDQRDSIPKSSPSKRNYISNSTGKPPLHPSAQGVPLYNSPQGVTGNLREANLAGVTTFSPSNPEQYLASGSLKQTNADRRYSSNTLSYSPQNMSPTASQRRYSEDVPLSPLQRARGLSSPMSSENSRGDRRTSDNTSGNPRSSRSQSSSRESELLFSQTIQPPIVELPSSFTLTDGSELVEQVRSRTSVSYRKTLVAVSGVLEFLKNKVPACAEMMDGLLRAVQESQVERSPASTRKAEASSDLDRLREIFFEITELKNDSQQRGWAVHDDLQAIVDIMEELLQILCDANPEVSKAAVEEDKYENMLTLITYYQMESRIPIRLLLLKVFGVLCGLDGIVVRVLLGSVLPNELGRDIQQNISQIQKTMYSCTVSTMIFSTADAVPLPVYDQWSEEYVLFLLDTVEHPPLEDDEEQIPDAFLNVILSFNQHFPDPSSNLVMKALSQCLNPRNFSEKLMFLVNRGEDPVAISTPCCPDSMTKFLLDVFADKATSGLFYTTDMMVLIDIVARQLADLGPEEESRVHFLELLYRIVDTTSYADHRHRQHELLTSLTRIAHEENADGTPDCELVHKIWKTYPGLFEETTDL